MAEETDDILEDAIKENASGPAKASGDSGSMEQHRLPDVIDSEKYLLAKKAMAQKNFGLRRVKIVSPGAV